MTPESPLSHADERTFLSLLGRCVPDVRTDHDKQPVLVPDGELDPYGGGVTEAVDEGDGVDSDGGPKVWFRRHRRVPHPVLPLGLHPFRLGCD